MTRGPRWTYPAAPVRVRRWGKGGRSVEAVCPTPVPQAVRIRRDVGVGLESHELPRPSRERRRALVGCKIEHDVAFGGVPGPRVEDDIGVEGALARRLGVDDLRTRFDLFEIRGGDRAEVTGLAPVFRALFGELEIPAPSHGGPPSRELPSAIDPTSGHYTAQASGSRRPRGGDVLTLSGCHGAPRPRVPDDQ